MKTFLLLFPFFYLSNESIAQNNQAPTAITAPNKLVVLPINSVTLTSSGGSGSWNWTEVSAHTISVTGFSVADNMTSGATITNNNDGTATLSNVNKQGTYYFQVNSGGNSATMALFIRCVPPISPIYIWDSLLSPADQALTAHANTYGNTFHQISYGRDPNHWSTGNNGAANTLFSDDAYGNHKLYTVLSSNAGSPRRTEMQKAGQGVTHSVDTGKVYMYEWQGYFTDASAAGKSVDVWMWQDHASNGITPPMVLGATNGELSIDEYYDGTNTAMQNWVLAPPYNPAAHDNYHKLTNSGFLSQLTQAPHTIRVTFKEGLGNAKYASFTPAAGSTAFFIPNAPQKAFIKVEVDGKLVYLRNNGNVGESYTDQPCGICWGFDYKLVTGAYHDQNLFTGVTQVQTISNSYQFGTGQTSYYEGASHGTTPNQIQLPFATAKASSVSGGTATLYGYGNNITGYIKSRTWTKVSGIGGTITSPNSDTTTITGLGSGAYTFQLVETDNYGQTATTTVNINNGSVNSHPVANAGADQVITMPKDSVTLSGSASDPGGTITNFFWTKISGPSSGIINNASTLVTLVKGLVQGTYQFQLKVTDNNGATGLDTVQVTVNPGINIPPVANAGSNQSITLPVDSVTFSGSGSDADGTVMSYLWTKISGPSSGIISNAGSATTTVIGLVQGTYQFQLQVVDNLGAIGTSMLQVIVAPPNPKPVVNAGGNQSIILPQDSILLSGSANEAGGTITSYLWTKISGPSSGTFANDTLASTTFTGLVQGVYLFQLQVTDNNGAVGADVMQVTVNAAANIPPVANAGVSQSITLPVDSVTLSGSGTDSDGTVVSYLWTRISGPSSGIITNDTLASSTVTGLAQGVYQFQLQVTDNAGAIGTSITQVTVNSSANISPVANAGSDQTIILPTDSVTLSGSGSDADGTVTGYLWTKISGPSSGTFANDTLASTTFTGLVQGVYLFQLQVTDNNGAVGADVMQVTVNAAANIPPVANAGVSQSITLPVDSVTLSGSGTDSDGTVVSYLWTRISGPSSGIITNDTLASSTVTGLAQGVYQFQLQVTDNAGAIGTSITQVTVNSSANISPVANAGSDQTIILPTESVTLSGSGSDADGTVTGYLWTKISGPSSGTFANDTLASTTFTGLVQGVYLFQLQVTDNNGAVGADVMQVTVNAAANIPPVANAGVSQSITLPVDSVTLSGSGTDSDGTVVSYLWTRISGPSSGIITNDTLASSTVTGLAQGVYQFQLQVTDNAGAIGTSITQVTVNSSANISPVANAGSDQTIILPTDSVTLSGSGSDADGTVTGYLWTKISGPSSGTFANDTLASTTFTGLVQGVYLFQLQVTDNNGAVGADVMQVTVNAAANIPPEANAGVSQSITLPANSVTLTGSGSDADGTIVSYLWTKISGPSSGTITNTGSASTTVTSLAQGVYQFQLQVTDNAGAIGTSITQVTVNSSANISPVANAGSDQTIILPTESVTLSGSGSDADGTVTGYLWTKISGPSSGTFANDTLASTTFTGLVQGVYLFQLQVTDNNGAVGADVMQVTVNAAANIPPVANAGVSQSITLPVDSVTLSGSGTDSDGTVVSYLWTRISGPSSGIITNDTLASSTVTGLAQGVYQFQLQVTDNAGAIGTSITQVTVNSSANISPVANAGSDQTIILPTDSVTLSGSGSDADGTVTGYLWTKISGPSSGTFANDTLASTTFTGLVQGVYLFQLQVTDNNGAVGADVMQVTVNAAANIPPEANAGVSQSITLPANSVTLTGSGSDADGTIVSYLWTKISGPSSGTITNTGSASTTVTSLVQGVYQYRLQVTDNSGATGTAVVQVTVNAAVNIPPVANAGTDQTITLPVNSLTLSGSGSDADGTVVSYLWTKVSGPSSGTIVNSGSANTNVTGLVQGVYQFQLTVTDNNGAVGTDAVQVTVNAAANTPPVANAGVNQSITLPANSVTLTGSGSDADGTVVSYLWTKTSGPSSGTITNTGSASTTVTSLVQGVYQYRLQVTDNSGATGTAVVQVTVNAAVNIPPVANAGTDQTITLPVNSLTLSGSGSDADGTVVSYLWTKVSGPFSGTIVNSGSANTNVTGLVQGVYQFQLTVTDNNGAVGTDAVQVTVNAAANTPPVANAGVNQSITLPANSVTLTGSGSDADGTVVSYLWTKTSGPSSGTITNTGLASTTVTSLVQGVYQYRLQVTDNSGATGTAVVQVTVNAAVNIPPVANAGTDQTITLPVNSLTLSGSGSDADGTVVSYLWTKVSGPSSGTIVNSGSANTNVTGLVQGVYQFQLTVTDNNGAVGTDAVQVTVNAAANTPPVANAGVNQSITLPANSVTLTGSGSDADGTVVSYLWTKTSGPSSGTITNTGSASTTVTSLVQGVYQYRLQVTDNSGATGTAVVQVTVNAAVNIPPVANAGTDQTITLPVNSLTLSGSGSDADGTVVSYLWTKVSGPFSGTIVNSGSANTNVTGLVQGVYQFQLTVTDNNGAVGTDAVQVTVNAAANTPPVANAGVNQSITLPANSVTLTGSGSDADGTVVSYLWTKTSGPSSGTITNTGSASTTVTSLVQGVYQYRLQVTDNSGATGTAVVQVTVNAAVNIPPVANAGTDQTITLPVNSLTLSGSGSDADGTVVSYLWTKVSGPSSGSFVNASSPVTDLFGLVQGVYQFQLRVTDNNGAIGTNIMQVIVNAAANIPPVANAGPDQSITLPENSLTLSGSGSDVDGNVVSYLWTKLSGPSFGSITNANSATTSVTGLAQGVYQFQLQVTDNNGSIGKDVMQITVNAAENVPPVADAGPDQTVTLPADSVTLSGSGSDAGGTIAAYSWTQISGPSSGTIVTPGNAVTEFTGLVSGNYLLELTVTDNLGAKASDTVAISVAAPRLDLNLKSNTMNVYPNPVTDITTLEINTTQPDPDILVVITNMNGQIVYKSAINSGQTNIKQTLNLSNLMKGTFAVTVYFSNQEKKSIKMLKL